MTGEDALTAWLRDRLGPGHLLGDDAAVLPELPPGTRLVATVDSQIAGVHHPTDLDPALAARRLLAVNLSDAAAMGADPAWALLALSGPRDLDRRRYFDGLLAACREFGVTLAGGDLAGTEDVAIGTLTLLATLPAGRPPLLRSGARPGQAIWVAGTLGESGLGQRLLARGARMSAGMEGAEQAEGTEQVRLPPDLALPSELETAARRAVRRHLDPAAHLGEQLRLGRMLAESGAEGSAVGAAMDLSDGLAMDLPRLCRASGAGAEIDAAALPTAPGFGDLCRRLDLDPLELALSGGEDYVLLFTLPEGTKPPDPASSGRIGTLTENPSIMMIRDGARLELRPEGWDHLRR